MIENLRPEIMQELRTLGQKSDPMVPTTIRIDPDLERELREFCDSNNFKLGVLIRRLISLGWESAKVKTDNEVVG